MQKLTVSYTVQPQCTLIHVAQAKGFFAEERLEIQPVIHTFGKAALQLLLDGKADLATAAETPILFSILKGEKIFVLANVESSSTNNAVIARKDAGITQGRDLKGKRIGFTPGTTSDFFLSALLTANGLTREVIQEVGLKPEEMRDALLSGQVDAVSTWNYPLTQINDELGANGTLLIDQEIYTETYNLVARQDFVRKNPEAVKRFLRALLKAEQFTHDNPDEAQTIVSKMTQVNRDLVSKVWHSFGYRIVLDQILLIVLEDETRWAMSKRLTDRHDMPDYMSFIYFDGLQAVKPAAIRVKR
ncbi:MAG: NrtA/SsuA/CpmA family ABC transporter substrate-binding protein [Magnetococcales bacterium]|nr:NrtA/SsuA/CpmA family ABC transporter substrate-binding protein [Magnetococcales bacterium]